MSKKLYGGSLINILTNKYVLYIILFLTFTNLFGYLIVGNIKAIVFFSLIALVTYQFSKNMSILLLISLLITNLLMATSSIREGFTESTESTNTPIEESSTEETEDTELSMDPDINNAANILKKSSSVEEAKQKLKENKPVGVKVVPQKINDINNPTMNKKTNEIEPFGVGKNTHKKTNTSYNNVSSNEDEKEHNTNTGSRLDYASTMEAAYDNLDKMLGSDGIQNLTKDTQKLMSQQQELFQTMNTMAPMLQSAQKMLQGFDFKSLGNLGSLASSLGGAPIPKTK